MSAITLHHLNVSRSDRIFWCLEELGLEYNVKVYKRLPSRMAPPELKQVYPLGRAPVLEIDGKTLAESGSIIAYLLQHHGKPSQKEYNQDDSYWSHYAEGTLMILLQMGAVIGATSKGFVSQAKVTEEEGNGIQKYAGFLQDSYLRGQVQSNLDVINNWLAKSSGFFSNQEFPGQGDFQMFFPINSLLAGSRKDAGFEIGDAIRAWHKKVLARPACQKAMKRLEDEEKAYDEGQKAKM